MYNLGTRRDLTLLNSNTSNSTPPRNSTNSINQNPHASYSEYYKQPSYQYGYQATQNIPQRSHLSSILPSGYNSIPHQRIGSPDHSDHQVRAKCARLYSRRT